MPRISRLTSRRRRTQTVVALLAAGALAVPAVALAEPGGAAPEASSSVSDTLPPESPPVAEPTGSGPGGASDAVAPAAAGDQWAAHDNRSTKASTADYQALRGKAGSGEVPVIVGLQVLFTAEGALDAKGQGDQRAAIAQQRDAVLQVLQGAKHSVIHTYETVPYVALRLSADALTRLERSGRAASLQEDVPDPLVLDESTPIVEATESWAVGRSGAGQYVAILDTGVQKAHLFLRNSRGGAKVLSEACYSSQANCPGGVTESTAVGSGEPCTYSASCFHGTHVAGIAAGRGTASSGVARDASLIAIQVFSNFAGCSPCASVSDQIKGLERVNLLSATRRIASANMSLGGGSFTADCDGDSRKPIIDTLRSKHIATVIASGNDGFTNAVGAPSCISTAITVGSTTKADAVSSFSNSATMVELLAPGSDIQSSVPDSTVPRDDQGTASGTSMATPHVAGAWAVLKGAKLTATVPEVLGALQLTGRPILDTRNGITKPRIRLLAAGTRLAETGLRVALQNSGTGVNAASAGIGLRDVASGTIRLSGIPVGATLISSRLIWTTLGGPDDSLVFKGIARVGALAGASADTCWNINQAGPNRTYFVEIPAVGNGNHTVSGVASTGGGVAQGVTLVTIYSHGGGVGKVFQRVGASSAVPPTSPQAKASITTTGDGIHVRRPVALIAMGDGQSFTEGALSFGGAITSTNFFYGAAGTYWDDERIELAPTLIPSGTQVRNMTVNGIGDCLVMSGAAVSYATTS